LTYAFEILKTTGLNLIPELFSAFRLAKGFTVLPIANEKETPLLRKILS
jgi:hypothetical protein